MGTCDLRLVARSDPPRPKIVGIEIAPNSADTLKTSFTVRNVGGRPGLTCHRCT